MEQSKLESQVAEFVKNVVNFRQMLIRRESLDLSNEIKMNLNSDMEIYFSKVTMNTVLR